MKPSPFDAVATRMDQELHRDAATNAQALEAELLPVNAQRLGREGMLQFVSRNWNDRTPSWGPTQQPFREWLHQTLGPANFLTLFDEGEKRGMLKSDAVATSPMPNHGHDTLAPSYGQALLSQRGGWTAGEMAPSGAAPIPLGGPLGQGG